MPLRKGTQLHGRYIIPPNILGGSYLIHPNFTPNRQSINLNRQYTPNIHKYIVLLLYILYFTFLFYLFFIYCIFSYILFFIYFVFFYIVYICVFLFILFFKNIIYIKKSILIYLYKNTKIF